jgi:hypothetical protein
LQVDRAGRVIDADKHKGKLHIIEQEFANVEREEAERRKEEEEIRRRVKVKRYEAIERAQQLERLQKIRDDRRIRSEIVRIARGELMRSSLAATPAHSASRSSLRASKSAYGSGPRPGGKRGTKKKKNKSGSRASSGIRRSPGTLAAAGGASLSAGFGDAMGAGGSAAEYGDDTFDDAGPGSGYPLEETTLGGDYGSAEYGSAGLDGDWVAPASALAEASGAEDRLAAEQPVARGAAASGRAGDAAEPMAARAGAMVARGSLLVDVHEAVGLDGMPGVVAALADSGNAGQVYVRVRIAGPGCGTDEFGSAAEPRGTQKLPLRSGLPPVWRETVQLPLSADERSFGAETVLRIEVMVPSEMTGDDVVAEGEAALPLLDMMRGSASASHEPSDMVLRQPHVASLAEELGGAGPGPSAAGRPSMRLRVGWRVEVHSD